MTADRWGVSVVIPARDEGALIARCIASVLESARGLAHEIDVTVVADRCHDDTAAAAAAALDGAGRVLELDVGSVGTGRRLGVARSLAALGDRGIEPERTWLLATDADSTVPPTWVATHLGHAAGGVHGVAGIVVVDSFQEHRSLVEPAFRARYEIHLSGEHPHVHGTNLGVRADAYAAAGGWLDLATGEDHDLWTRLKRAGATLVSTTESPVSTSGRAVGRAPDGFAALLRSLDVSEGRDGIAG